MHLTEIIASNFRCFSEQSPLAWRIGQGMNILVGENDSGKSAIIDAIRLVLGTRSEDFRLCPEDFYCAPDGTGASELLIRCSFAGLSDQEEASFLEWCSIGKDGTLALHAVLRATLVETASGAKRVVAEWRSGMNGDGPAIQGALREHVRVTYLRPLRDAESELSAGRRSRLSQILAALPVMKGQAKNDFASGGPEPVSIAGIVAKADQGIRDNPTIRQIESEINTEYLADLSVGGEQLAVALGIGSSVSLTQILERLELLLVPPGGRDGRLRRGLGLNNVLFMAAELLLLQSQGDQIPLLLVEEPEAHLHPQLQSRFIQIISERAKDAVHPVQIILTTHSPLLASNIPLEEMTMVAAGQTFPMNPGATRLEADDYTFLRRFLDATKANLFFAKGVLIVEGDGENLLLPAIAEKIGRSFTKYGISIVKVGHVGLFRYSRILQRAVGTPLPVPVACLADRDIPPDAAKPYLSESRKTLKDFSTAEIDAKLARLKQHDGENVKTFPSDIWTLEYDLAYFGLARELWQAIRLAERLGEAPETVRKDAILEFDSWGALTPEEVAIKVYGYMLDESISKAIVAQNLADLILSLPDDANAFAAKLPSYIVAAIHHAAPEPATTAESDRIAAATEMAAVA